MVTAALLRLAATWQNGHNKSCGVDGVSESCLPVPVRGRPGPETVGSRRARSPTRARGRRPGRPRRPGPFPAESASSCCSLNLNWNDGTRAGQNVHSVL